MFCMKLYLQKVYSGFSIALNSVKRSKLHIELVTLYFEYFFIDRISSLSYTTPCANLP